LRAMTRTLDHISTIPQIALCFEIARCHERISAASRIIGELSQVMVLPSRAFEWDGSVPRGPWCGRISRFAVADSQSGSRFTDVMQLYFRLAAQDTRG
jgi:hypothetical protein